MNSKGTSARSYPCPWPILLVLLLANLCQAGEAPREIYNPQPADGDFILPMPGGAGMVFRTVFIGEGGGPFALRKFKVGDPDTKAGFKESPTAVVIGGAFLGKRKGNPDWFYSLSKYEVTEAQYYAIMDPPSPGSAEVKSSQLPVTNISWYEANTFVNRYNEWLFANAVGKLPQVEDAISFVRLPTEVEWEFAARGGAEVSADDFDHGLPYKGNLAEYEWFSGPKSSYNKVKKVGLLKPNPLGLHDMLGNVSEMTHSLYQIEYYQGRTGGFVSRGGNCRTLESELRSSLRSEQPFYRGNPNKERVQPNRQETMGLRLVLSSTIIRNFKVDNDLKTAWNEYREASGSGFPAALSVSPVKTQIDVQGEDAFKYFERLKKDLSQMSSLPQPITEDLAYLETSLGQIKFIRKQADESSAYAWAKIAGEQAFDICKWLTKLPTSELLITLAEKEGTPRLEDYRRQKAELLHNIDDALTTYSDSLRQLVDLEPATVTSGFEKYSTFLKTHSARDEQIRVGELTRGHYAAFANQQRADRDRWRADFGKIAQELLESSKKN
jgi:hypothetical protein